MNEEMELIRTRLQCANNRLRYLTDEKEIDSCIYLIKSLEMQYGILLKQECGNPEGEFIA